MNYYVCVTGGRDWTDRAAIEETLGTLQRFYGDDLRVIHGANPNGADRLAESVCKQLGITFRRYPADWDTHGKKAGILRNQQMADLLRKWRDEHGHWVQVVAFPTGGPGTKNMIFEAAKRDIHVDVMA